LASICHLGVAWDSQNLTSGNFFSAANFKGPYKTLEDLDDTLICCSVESYNLELLASLHCDRYKSKAWHVLSSAISVTLPFPQTWSQWRPLCKTNLLCPFHNLWCHLHSYGMHANNMPWDVIFSPLGFTFSNSLARAFQHHHFVLSFLVLLECLWLFNYSSTTCQCEFHGGATFLPWFCAFSWITRLTKEFQFCC
jgi:hypothetical protein